VHHECSAFPSPQRLKQLVKDGPFGPAVPQVRSMRPPPLPHSVMLTDRPLGLPRWLAAGGCERCSNRLTVDP
jgi:hypothetical protein